VSLRTRGFRAFRESTDRFRVAIGWTILFLLALLMEYGSVRVCPKWGLHEKGALASGWAPFLVIVLVWALGILLLGFHSPGPTKPPAPATPEPAAPARRHDGATFLLCALTTLAVAHLFLLSPLIPKPFWAFPIRLSAHLGFPLNWDSPLLMDLALSPERLLQAGSVSLPQNRPLYIWLTAGLTQALAPLARASGLADLYGVPHPAFLPGIVLNWGLLTLAFFLFWRLVGRLGGPFAVYAAALCAIPFLANDIVKAFFWTLHMQFFNLLVPVLGILVCRSVLAGSPFSFSKTFLVGLGLGASSLAYESFVFIVPAIAAAFFLKAKPAGAKAYGREGLAACLLAVGFALPQLVWMAAIRMRTGGFRRAPFQTDRDFVWLADSLSVGVGETLTRLFSYFVLFLRTLWAACGLLIVCGVLLVFIGSGLGLRLSPSNPARRATLRAAWLTFFSAVTLLFFMGQYLERYSFFVGPVLLVLCGLWLMRVLEKSARAVRVGIYGAFATVGVVWLIYQVAKYGPYS